MRMTRDERERRFMNLAARSLRWNQHERIGEVDYF